MSDEKLIYIASPFFTPEQIQEVEKIENLCTSCGYPIFSPRFSKSTSYIKSCIHPESWEFELSKKFLFKDDIDAMNDCDCMIVNPNSYDSGTLFELGMAIARGLQIFPSHQSYTKLIQDSIFNINELSEKLEKSEFIYVTSEFEVITVNTTGIEKPKNKYIIAESCADKYYRGFSKVILGYLYELGYYSIYVDVPRKSNIMLTSSCIVYETRNLEYVVSLLTEKTDKKELISYIQNKCQRVIGRLDD